MNILIAGASGFIGSNLFNFFRNDENYTVLGADQNSLASDKTLQIDFKDSQSVTQLCQEIEEPTVFINCIGNTNLKKINENPPKDLDTNLLPLYTILESIKNNKNIKLIHISSAAVYGKQLQERMDEKSPLDPQNHYGAHKLFAEQLCNLYRKTYNTPIVILRPFNIYGEGQKGQLLWDMYHKQLHQKPAPLFGTGKEVRDFIHITDFCRAVGIVIKNFNSYDTLNIANGIGLSISEIASSFEKAINSKDQCFYFTKNNRDNATDKSIANIERLQSLGYKQTIPLDEGIASFISWVQNS